MLSNQKQCLKTVICLLLALVFNHGVSAATCSCSAVPLLGSMEFSNPEAGNWLLSSKYEFHDISDLFSGTNEVNDETHRTRESRSLILESSYGFNEKWSITALISAVEHKRKVGTGAATVGDGIGDGLLLVKYAPLKVGLFSRHGISLGLGAIVPLGDENQADFVRLAEDLQPSTGAWSGIFWSQYTHSFDQAARRQIFSALSYSLNGENDADYHFGDSLVLSVGASYRTSGRWGIIVDFRYRSAKRDERHSVKIPNTGGEWLELVPSIQYHFTDQWAGSLSARLPIWRDLNDALQFTTAYAYSFSLTYALQKRNRQKDDV